MLTSHRHWRCANTTHPWLAVSMPTRALCGILRHSCFASFQCDLHPARAYGCSRKSWMVHTGQVWPPRDKTRNTSLPSCKLHDSKIRGNPFPPRNSTLAYLPIEIPWNLCGYHIEYRISMAFSLLSWFGTPTSGQAAGSDAPRPSRMLGISLVV